MNEVFEAVGGCRSNSFRRQDKEKYDYGAESLRSVLSMLVHDVYFRDLNRFGDTVATLIGYQNGKAENYGKQYWERLPPPKVAGEWQADELDLKKLGLEFFLRKDPHPNESAPRLAIVLRGTILYKHRDLHAAMNISADRLRKTTRFERCKKLISAIISEFQTTHGVHEPICMAGHSLGAAIALQVGRCLASTDNICIDTHLFNPPLWTIGDFVTSKTRTERANWGDYALSSLKSLISHADPIFSSFFDSCKNQRTNDGHVLFPLRLFIDLIRNDSNCNTGRTGVTIGEDEKQFRRLESWIPHLYLSPTDPICSRYIKFYKNHLITTTTEQTTCISTCISESRKNVVRADDKYMNVEQYSALNYINVVPCADLYISKRHKWHPIRAHHYRQWHKYNDKDIKLERFSARVPAPPAHRTAS